MWMILALVISLAVFALLSLSHMEQSELTVMHSEDRVMETQSAVQMDNFTSAAWAYATADSLGSGSQITVSELINAGYLPTGFSANNAFGQTISALTGTKTLVVYYQNQPTVLLGEPVVPITEAAVATKIAERLSAMQENTPVFVAAISANSGGNGPYNQALLPYTLSNISVTNPAFSTTFPSALDLVNILPSTGATVN